MEAEEVTPESERVHKQEAELKQLAWARLVIVTVVFLVMIAPSIYLIVEERRIGNCIEDVITTTNKRDEHTAQLRSYNDRVEKNINKFNRDTISLLSLPADQRREAYVNLIRNYNAEATKIQEERKATRARQDKYQFPSLEECVRT